MGKENHKQGSKADLTIKVECTKKGISIEAHNEGDDSTAFFGVGALLASLEKEKGYNYENMLNTIHCGYLINKMQEEKKK